MPDNPWAEGYFDVPFHDPNVENLVDIVSIRQPALHAPTKTSRLCTPLEDLYESWQSMLE